MKTMTKRLIASASLACLTAFAVNAQAQAGTGTLVGWSVLGDAVAQGARSP